MHIFALKAVAAPFQIITKKVSSYRQKTQKEIPKNPKDHYYAKTSFFAETLMMVLLLVSFQKNVFKNIKQ